MSHYFFDDKISVESVNRLITDLQDKENIELWFATEGGNLPAMYFLVSFLNARKDIKVVLTDQIYSAGTMLLTHYTGELYYKKLTLVLFHCWDRLRYPLRKSDFISDDIIQKQDQQENQEFAEILKSKSLLTDKQIKQFLKGKDVVWYAEDIKSKLKELQYEE